MIHPHNTPDGERDAREKLTGTLKGYVAGISALILDVDPSNPAHGNLSTARAQLEQAYATLRKS